MRVGCQYERVRYSEEVVQFTIVYSDGVVG